GADEHDREVRDEQAEDEGEQHRDAESGARRATDRGDPQDLGARLGPDPADHPDPERRPGAVRAHLERLDMLVAVEAGLDEAPAVPDDVEHEHPAAAEAEAFTAAGAAIDGDA